ncbi:MAG: hypothetical protein WC861_05345 [Candidatus Micrarchaeia archaeon]
MQAKQREPTQNKRLRKIAFDAAAEMYSENSTYGKDVHKNKIDALLASFSASQEDIVGIKQCAVAKLIEGKYANESHFVGARKLAEEFGWMEGAAQKARERLALLESDAHANAKDAASLAESFGLTDKMKLFGEKHLRRVEEKLLEHDLYVIQTCRDWWHLKESYIAVVGYAKKYGIEMDARVKGKFLPYMADSVLDYCLTNAPGGKDAFKAMFRDQLGLNEEEAKKIAAEVMAGLSSKLDECRGKGLASVLGDFGAHNLFQSIIRFFGDFGTQEELEGVFRRLTNERPASAVYYITPILIAEYGLIERLSDLNQKLSEAGCFEWMLKEISYGARENYYYTALKDYEKAGVFAHSDVRRAYFSIMKSQLEKGKLDEAARLANEFGLDKEAKRISKIKELLQVAKKDGG